MNKLYYALAIVLITISCNSQTADTPGYQKVDNAEWEISLAASDVSPPQIIDVRTPAEFEAGNIPGSVNVDYLAPGFMEKMEAYTKDQPIFIYCKSGGRSTKASHELQAAGFTEIVELANGYDDYPKE